jgi:hypothetical protein
MPATLPTFNFAVPGVSIALDQLPLIYEIESTSASDSDKTCT